jgi:putative transposase
LKKNLDNCDDLRQLIDSDHGTISVQRQCELVGLARSTYYHTPTGEAEWNLMLMRLLDEKYTEEPYFGVLRMTALIPAKPA